MTEQTQPDNNPFKINIRPPSFQRRAMAAGTDDPDTLIALASDESYFVRRTAVDNPNTPYWVLDLLVRAGATPDLRGKGNVDPDLDADSLRRLVETGPYARQLVAEHPNTSAEVLAALKDQPSIPIRLAVAAHPNADQLTLASLCCDIESNVRGIATANTNCPSDFIDYIVAAGAQPDLQGISRKLSNLSPQQLSQISAMGPWGRFLAARHTNIPQSLIEEISQDSDWRVRSGLLDNPNSPPSILIRILESAENDDIESIQLLGQEQTSGEILSHLAFHSSPEVRLSLARHPATTPSALGQLASDGIKEIRRLAASHPNIRAAEVETLVRAGSTPDLMGLDEPDPTMSATEISKLLEGGIWARQLAVRHPKTSPETVARLLCDRESKIREWAAVHPNLSSETKSNLIRAGSGTDFQGIMPPVPGMEPDQLRQISQLGSWGEWVVANNHHAPAELLEELSVSNDWQVRVFVARNPNAPSTILERLEVDPDVNVRQAALAASTAES